MRASRGGALVQAVIMGIMMALIATYLLRWAFGRYILVSRHQASTAAAANIEGCLQQFRAVRHAQWSGSGTLPAAPFSCPFTVNGVTEVVTIQRVPIPGTSNFRLQATRNITIN